MLEAGPFVVHMQRGHHAVGDDAGAKRARGTLGDPASEDELYLFGPADVEVFSNHFFKEDATRQGSIQNLSKGEFDLQDGKVVLVSGLTVAERKGVGQEAEPLP